MNCELWIHSKHNKTIIFRMNSICNELIRLKNKYFNFTMTVMILCFLFKYIFRSVWSSVKNALDFEFRNESLALFKLFHFLFFVLILYSSEKATINDKLNVSRFIRINFKLTLCTKAPQRIELQFNSNYWTSNKP